jgi:hypothetical protein
MPPLERWLFQESPHGAVCNGVEHLYHGISASALAEILAKHGEIAAPSYWGTERLTRYYACEAAKEEGTGGRWGILRVALRRFVAARLSPCDNSVAAPVKHTLHGDEELNLWRQSRGTWQDALRIYGSVRYDGPVRITQPDLIEVSKIRSGTDTQVTQAQIAQFLNDHLDWSPELNDYLCVCGFRSPQARFYSLGEIANLIDK